MRDAEILFTNFSAGEVSPKLAARVDLARQQNSCIELENFLIDPLGGAVKVPGTKFIAETKSSGAVRLIPFIYSDEQAYVLEFGDLYIRFYKDGGQITDSGSPYEIVSPYPLQALRTIQWCQSADVMYLTHKEYPVYKLSRTGHTAWTIAAMDFGDGPWMPVNAISDAFITSSATTSATTLTATANIFTADHVGAYFRLRHSGMSQRDAFYQADWVTGSYMLYGKFTVDLTPYQILESDGSGSIYASAYNYPWEGQVVLQKSYDSTNWVDVDSFFYASKKEFIETEYGVYYRCLCKEYSNGYAFISINQDEKWGVVQILSVTSATEAEGWVVYEIGATTPTSEWRESAWSPANGYPQAAVFGPDDRLWFAGSSADPLTLWASWVGDYENHHPGMAQADGALTLTINDRDASSIVWLMNYRGVAVGTTNGEGIITSGEQGGAITAKSPPVYTKHTTNGSTAGVVPVRVGPSMLFLHRHRRQIRELTYDVAQDGFNAPNLNQLAEHITSSGIKDMCMVDYPIPQLWCVRYDGEIAVLTYLRREEVVGWSRVVMNGDVESICSIPSALSGDEGEDQVWLVVERTVAGSVKRFVELLQNNEDVEDIEDYWYLHCALDYDSTATTTVSGLSHLAGETVSCLADGFVLSNKVVSAGGVVTLGGSYSRVIVGLPYTATIQPSRKGGQTPEGIKKRIVKMWLRLYKSLGGTIGPNDSTQDAISMRTPGTDFRAQVEPFTGDWPIAFPAGASEAPDIVIKHTQPLPFCLLGIVAKMVVYDS